jgi:hypothetical protein
MDRIERRVAAWIFAAFFILFAAITRGHFVSTDEVLVYQATQSLWDDGNLSVDAFDKREAVKGRNGERYAQYNSGQSIAAIPLLLLGRGTESLLRAAGRPDLVAVFAGREISRPGVVWGGEIEIFFVILLNAAFTAALCALFFLFSVRLGASTGRAVTASAILGTATYPAGFATGFFQHPSETFFLLLAFYLLFLDSRRPDWRLRAGAGVAVGLMLQFRFPAVFGVPALFLYSAAVIWRRSPTRARVGRLLSEGSPFAAAVAAGFVLHAIDEWVKFEVLLNRGYGDQGFNTPLLTGLRGLLVSPGHSIFLYTPLLLLVPWFFRSFFRSHPLEAGLVMAQTIIYTVVYAMFDSWHGMACFGPRYLVQLVPLLLLPLGLWLGKGSGGRVAVAFLALGGLWVQMLHVTVNFWYVLLHERLFEFQPPNGFLFIPRYNQILAHWRALLAGDGRVDFWLLNVARDFGGATAGGIAAAMALLFLVAVMMVVRETRAGTRLSVRLEPAWSLAAGIFAITVLIITIGSARGEASERPGPGRAADVRTGDGSDSSEVQAALMKEGLDALYARNDAGSAEERFRAVLRLNPTHYGATYQLATALDRLNRRDEATPLWQAVLRMAESYADEETAGTARSRLGAQPSGST